MKLFMNDYVPAHVKIPQKVLNGGYSGDSTIVGRRSLVRVTIGCNSISMQFYERPKTAINLY